MKKSVQETIKESRAILEYENEIFDSDYGEDDRLTLLILYGLTVEQYKEFKKDRSPLPYSIAIRESWIE